MIRLNGSGKRNEEDATPVFSSQQELEKVFKTFDANGDGKISSVELGNIMRSFGYEGSEEELCAMVKEVDSDGDGFISFDEFVQLNESGAQEGNTNEELKDAFKMFDVDGSGSISAIELHKVLKALGDKSTMEDCYRMIKSVDKDGDGFVNFEEFKAMMNTKSSSSSS